MKTIFQNTYLRYTLVALGSLFLGWILFHTPAKPVAHTDSDSTHTSKASAPEVWTCAMHPQIRQPKAGLCPLCAMELVLLNTSGTVADPAAIQLSAEAAQLANVHTSTVVRQAAVKDLRLFGKVQADERRIQSQVAYISGRIEKLRVNFTGEQVHKGQVLAQIYSPDLVTTQQELLEAAKIQTSQPAIYLAAKDKLRQWKLTEAQIKSIEQSGKVLTYFDIVATTSGIVSTRRVNTGDYINPGTVLFEITDLSQLWVLFDAYETDLPFINQGDLLNFTVQALPGQQFSGRIAFVDPVVDATTRVSKVRIEMNNSSGKLKPEMFVVGELKAKLNAYRNQIIVPRSAVLWTGKRSLVYVKQANTDEPMFKVREVTLGPMLGSSYVIESGLTEGEQIVTQGTFSVDAAAQLEGKPSMMNRESASQDANPQMEATPKMDNSDKSTTSQSTTEASMHNMAAMGNPIQKQALKQSSLKVSGNCDMCKARIEKAAKSVTGVTEAVWDAKTKQLNLKFDNQTNSISIEKAIATAGHDTPHHKALGTNYSKLPGCCKYRD